MPNVFVIYSVNCWSKAFGAALMLATALGEPALAQVSSRFDGQYVGQLTLTKVRSGDCTEPPPGALYPLTISGGHVQFNYTPRFDTILRGTVDQNGIVNASRRLRKGSVSMVGRIQDNNATAHITSPSCEYTFQTNQ